MKWGCLMANMTLPGVGSLKIKNGGLLAGNCCQYSLHLVHRGTL